MEHFGDRVVAVKGHWTYGDNPNEVNTQTTGGAISIESAAAHGPTGRYALAHGFGFVQLLEAIGVPGAYTTVVVLFTK